MGDKLGHSTTIDHSVITTLIMLLLVLNGGSKTVWISPPQLLHCGNNVALTGGVRFASGILLHNSWIVRDYYIKFKLLY